MPTYITYSIAALWLLGALGCILLVIRGLRLMARITKEWIALTRQVRAATRACEEEQLRHADAYHRQDTVVRDL